MAQTVLLIGDCGVGKTALCKALRNGLAKNDANNIPTVGVQASVAACLGPGVLLWDCSGNAASESLRMAHVKRASCLVAVFDVSRYHILHPRGGSLHIPQHSRHHPV